ncbi:MAG: polysaccharide deacetylase family protein [Bacteroidales bacterium]|jgi:peptidoglycan/xylan/chitin deacetylase (PgdA/CDA1 family)|nr:polysaccharide deacetylase family protein [Bacteroidales bacterium]
MKIFLKNKVLPLIASGISLQRLIQKGGGPLIHIFYHTISDCYLPYIGPLYKPKLSKEFIEDIDFMFAHFKPVDIYRVLRHVKGEEIIDFPAFHLSFDDGLSNIFDVVSPILQQREIPATIFVNSAFVDNKELFFRHKAALLIDALQRMPSDASYKVDEKLHSIGVKGNNLRQKLLHVNYLQRYILDDIAEYLSVDFIQFLKQERPYLDSEELKILQTRGFSIGAHSIDHPKYSLLTREERILQTIESCNFVAEQFGEKNKFFVFPFGDEGGDRTIFDELFGHVDLIFGIAGTKNEFSGRYIHRIDMELPSMAPERRIKKALLTSWLKNL